MGKGIPKQPPSSKPPLPKYPPPKSRAERGGPENRQSRTKALNEEREKIDQERLRMAAERDAKRTSDKAKMDELTKAFAGIGKTPDSRKISDFSDFGEFVEATPAAVTEIPANPYPNLFYFSNHLDNPTITKVEADHEFNFQDYSYLTIVGEIREDINNLEALNQYMNKDMNKDMEEGGGSTQRKKRRTNTKQPSKSKKGSKRKSSRRRTSKKSKR